MCKDKQFDEVAASQKLFTKNLNFLTISLLFFQIIKGSTRFLNNIILKLHRLRAMTFDNLFHFWLNISQGIHPKTRPLTSSKTKNNHIIVRWRSSLKDPMRS